MSTAQQPDNRQSKKLQPSSKVIFVTMHANADYVRPAFEAGASGYVLKRSAVDESEQAISRSLFGSTPSLQAFIPQRRVWLAEPVLALPGRWHLFERR